VAQFAQKHLRNPVRVEVARSGAVAERASSRCSIAVDVTITLESSTPAGFLAARIIRKLAWCGTSSFRSCLVKPFFFKQMPAISDIRRTAYLNTCDPFLVHVVHTLLDGFLGLEGGANRPPAYREMLPLSHPRHARIEGSLRSGRRLEHAAPAPSPNSTHVARSL